MNAPIIGTTELPRLNDLTKGVARRGRTLAANVATLSRTVDRLVERLGTMPVAAAEPVVTVTASDEGWAVQIEGTANVLVTHPTKDEAVEAARALAAERAPSHLIVYEKDGTIQDRVSYHA